MVAARESNAGILTEIVHRMRDACESAVDFGGATITNFGPELDALLARVSK